MQIRLEHLLNLEKNPNLIRLAIALRKRSWIVAELADEDGSVDEVCTIQNARTMAIGVVMRLLCLDGHVVDEEIVDCLTCSFDVGSACTECGLLANGKLQFRRFFGEETGDTDGV